MNPTQRLAARKQQLVAELSSLGAMRKGSVSQQYVEVVLKDGSVRRRGPYALYTCKEQGKTLSRRLRDPAQVALYEEQIGAFRRFQELTAELAQLSQRLADREAEDSAAGKKNSRR
jgi:hypothetical protein